MTAKPISIKDAKRKSGGRASKTVELTSGDPPCVPMPVGTKCAARDVDRMGEVSRGRSSPKNVARTRGRLPRTSDRVATRIKAQTVCNRQVIRCRQMAAKRQNQQNVFGGANRQLELPFAPGAAGEAQSATGERVEAVASPHADQSQTHLPSVMQ